MANEYYSASGWPASKSAGVSATGRSELLLLQAAFDKLPPLAANAGKVVFVNGGGSGLTATGVSGTGLVAMTTNPVFVTPTLGAALATSINGISISGTAGKGLVVAAILGLTGTDGSTLNIGTGGTLGTAAYTAASAYAAAGAAFFIGTTSIANNRGSGAQALTGITSIDGFASTCTTVPALTGVVNTSGASNATTFAGGTTGAGAVVLATSPTLVTPTLGVALATSINGVGFTGVAGSTINVGAGGFMPSHVHEFRLSIVSGDPCPVSDTFATTLYMTPYVGNQIALYNGTTGWMVRQTAEISIAVPAVASQMYDVFCFDNAGTPTLELLPWTNDTTRATALVRQDGVYCKTGALTRRYIGSIRTNGANQACDAMTARWVWNMNNRIVRPMRLMAGPGTAWNYAVATVRQANADVTKLLDFIVGLTEDSIHAHVLCATSSSASSQRSVGIGYDSTSSYHAACAVASTNDPVTQSLYSTLHVIPPAVGRHFLSWNEYAATGICSFFGDTLGLGLAGIFGEIRA